MKKMQKIFNRVSNGEFICDDRTAHISKKYRADTPLDKSFVPYLIMAFCCAVDAAVFINLFKKISYDSPFLLAVEVAGLLFVFDVVPIYIGIQLRRLKQKLSKDSFIMWFAAAVCIIGVALNTFLRINTIDLMSPVSTSTSYIGSIEAASASPQGVDSTAIALTVFGICLPILTSVGSFFISYLTYNPLKTRMHTLEETITLKTDDIRRLDAFINEFDADVGYAQNLLCDDDNKYFEAIHYHKAIVLGYTDHVRQRLKEHLADPSSTSRLSKETCIDILERLDLELIRLNTIEVNNQYIPVNNRDRI